MLSFGSYLLSFGGLVFPEDLFWFWIELGGFMVIITLFILLACTVISRGSIAGFK
jgi:hypothetical protein